MPISAANPREQGAPDPTAVHSAWIVVQSNNGQQKVARASMRGEGFEVYLPMESALKKRWDGKWEVVTRPFFGRYLFCRITLKVERWAVLYGLHGVARVLCAPNGRPIGVADRFLEEIRRRERDGVLRVVPPGTAGACPHKAGDKVQTLAGLVDGIFQEAIDGRRAAILVSLLGRDSRVIVDLAKLVSSPST